ncbi:glycosyltransferase [Flavobacterium sp. KJJ]|uniref:glycosyltransferase n=1 Tax=Flavobacterium sp. KJJ TaxID=1270193 RepID=UPI00069240C5|nr:glycosyltransferase [Flavobacterium sp. KJJ]
MISIIICSRKNTIPDVLSINISETIGYEHEIIIIDNSENRHSIFEAYNIGIKKSKGDYLCFIHDDILFHTQRWGSLITNIFTSNPEYGLIGVAGSRQKTKTPSGWWDCESKYKSVNIIQHYPTGKIVKEQLGFEDSNLNEAVIVDGVFLAVRKEMNVVFDLKLKGFHNYDFNIAIETRKKKYKIGVTNQILIEHFSIGNLNNEWLESIIKTHKYYRNFLPLTTDVIIDRNAEAFSLKRLINHCLVTKGNKKRVFKYCGILFFKEPFSKSNVELFKKALIYLKSFKT